MAHLLENEFLRVRLVREEGGRVASITSKDSSLEFLLHSQPGRGRCKPGMQAAFRDGACAGIEECLPSVGACGSGTEGGPVPDHGDFWQLAWKVEGAPDESSQRLMATGFSRTLRFRKRARLRGRTLYLDYSVENTGDKPTSFLYACHPLLAVDVGDRVVLPEEVTRLSLNSSRGDRLGEAGRTIDWPLVLPGVDLSRVLARSAGVADMLYTARLRSGCCGLYRSSAQQGIAVRFDTAHLPYLGLWLCYGGWPEDGPEPRQYAVALEPTTAPQGTLKEAYENGQASHLPIGGAFKWTNSFEISESGVTLDQFRRFVEPSTSGHGT